MGLNNMDEYWVPEHVKDYLRSLGFVLPLDDMEPWIRSWDDWMGARGYVRTATEVSSDNSALMRNIRRHENALEGAITSIARAVMAVSRGFGEGIPDEGRIRVQYDDSIIQDVAAEKVQDMAEVGVTMHAWEYRQKWYGEDEKTAKARARGLAKDKEPKGEDA